MLYIHRPGEDSIMFGRYVEALSHYRDRLPQAVAHFASDEERFTLNHAKSLHDAWLESVTIQESRQKGSIRSGASAEIVLLGQQHDRHIRLSYHNVLRYEIRATGGEYPATFHGDLYTHEVRLSDNGMVIHELLFVTGAKIEIECEGFAVCDELLPKPSS